MLRRCRALFFHLPNAVTLYGDKLNEARGGDRSSHMVPWEVLKPIIHQNDPRRVGKVAYADDFQDMNINPSLTNALRTEFGIEKPSLTQKFVMPSLLDRKSAMVAAPTGSGKTLTYLLPVYNSIMKDRDVYKIPLRENRPRVLILTPTQELTQQVMSVCGKLDAHTGFTSKVYVGQSHSTRTWKRMTTLSKMDVLVISPALLEREISARRLFIDDVRHVIVDEADTLLSPQHGGSTMSVVNRLRARQDYDWLWNPETQFLFVSSIVTSSLNQFKSRAFPDAPSLVPPGIHEPTENSRHRFISLRKLFLRTDMLMLLLYKCGHRVLASTAKPTISRQPELPPRFSNSLNSLVVGSPQNDSNSASTPAQQQPVSEQEKSTLAPQRVIIFCSQAETCTALFFKLQGRGYKGVAQFHSMLPLDQRRETYARWRDGSISVLIATDIAARGLDDNVDTVINYDMPRNSALYLLRAGRTARMGRRGQIISLYTEKHHKPIVNALRTLMMRGKKLNDVSNWWDHYKPTHREWTRKRQDKLTRRLVFHLRRRVVAPHLAKTVLKETAMFRPLWHPETIHVHGGIPQRELDKREDKLAFRAWEARKEQLARRKKGSVRFGRKAKRSHRYKNILGRSDESHGSQKQFNVTSGY
eukprot:PhM_4_TR8234/c0_g1_i1/m.60381